MSQLGFVHADYGTRNFHGWEPIDKAALQKIYGTTIAESPYVKAGGAIQNYVLTADGGTLAAAAPYAVASKTPQQQKDLIVFLQAVIIDALSTKSVDDDSRINRAMEIATLAGVRGSVCNRVLDAIKDDRTLKTRGHVARRNMMQTIRGYTSGAYPAQVATKLRDAAPAAQGRVDDDAFLNGIPDAKVKGAFKDLIGGISVPNPENWNRKAYISHWSGVNAVAVTLPLTARLIHAQQQNTANLSPEQQQQYGQLIAQYYKQLVAVGDPRAAVVADLIDTSLTKGERFGGIYYLKKTGRGIGLNDALSKSMSNFQTDVNRGILKYL
jgi:hypothetical protein